jgi:FkbM family methyltransferase
MIKKVYYALLDLITFGKGVPVVINNFKVRLPARYYKYFSKNYEEENFTFFKNHCRQGMTTLDIGAHFGLFAVFFQKTSGGVVYAFEPTRETLKVFKETVAINKCQGKVEVVEMAVDREPGSANFFIHSTVGGRGNTLVQNAKLGMTSSSYEVKLTSVDVFVKEKGINVDCIKIDAEGAELGVLKGASATISKGRPIILLSIHPEPIQSRGDSLMEIWDLLDEYRYKVLLDGVEMSKHKFCTATDLFDVHLVPR